MPGRTTPLAEVAAIADMHGSPAAAGPRSVPVKVDPGREHVAIRSVVSGDDEAPVLRAQSAA